MHPATDVSRAWVRGTGCSFCSNPHLLSSRTRCAPSSGWGALCCPGAQEALCLLALDAPTTGTTGELGAPAPQYWPRQSPVMQNLGENSEIF